MTEPIKRAIRNTLFATFAIIAAMVLASCGATIGEMGVRELEPKGNDFNAALAREYKSLALYEKDKMTDWHSARVFGRKAVAAAAGETPPPERAADWDLDRQGLAEINRASRHLTQALYSGAASNTPEAAAKAQANFDCWIEQRQENFQPTHIARCRDAFYAALGEAGFSPGPEAAHMTPAALDSGQLNSMENGEDSTRTFVVFFEFDRDVLLPRDRGTVAAIAALAGTAEKTEALNAPAPLRVVIGGHTDRAGADRYNGVLSRKRAKAVRSALIQYGVDADRMTVQAFGETRALVDTPDGEREPRNRRVEITIGPSPRL